MRLFLAAMTRTYGSVQAYAAEQLGVDADQVAALRRNLLEPALAFRRAGEADLPVLVGLRDAAARWQIARGIDQWQPGDLGADHFRARLAEGEVWIATLGPDGPVVGAWELWWQDPAAWGTRQDAAGYVHRLMTDRTTAPPGTGRRMLAEAERRIAAAGLSLSRLDCLATNTPLRAYYQAAGYQIVGTQPAKPTPGKRAYAVTLLEKPLPPPHARPPANPAL